MAIPLPLLQKWWRHVSHYLFHCHVRLWNSYFLPRSCYWPVLGIWRTNNGWTACPNTSRLYSARNYDFENDSLTDSLFVFLGVGYATMTIVFFLDIYYCIIIAWTLFYLLATILSIPNLPWGSCGECMKTCEKQAFCFLMMPF